MSNLVITDLAVSQNLDDQALAGIVGGCCYYPPRGCYPRPRPPICFPYPGPRPFPFKKLKLKVKRAIKRRRVA